MASFVGLCNFDSIKKDIFASLIGRGGHIFVTLNDRGGHINGSVGLKRGSEVGGAGPKVRKEN